MKLHVWCWLGATSSCIALAAGCGGSVREIAQGAAGSGSRSPSGENAGAPGGDGNVNPGASGAGNSTSVPARGGAAGEGGCVGALDEVAARWGACPATLCAGMAWAESCSALLPGATTEIARCDLLTVITLNLSTHGKRCYYELGAPGEPKLVGAAAWDDTPVFCGRSSARIEAGKTSAGCQADSNKVQTVCGGTGGADNSAGGAAGEGNEIDSQAPPPACFNAFSSSCEPCCPTTPPECTGKPNGYPGYGCTPGANSFCSCACSSQAWSCGC